MALVPTSGDTLGIQRVRYTPYGVAQPQLLGDIDADGDVDTDDAAIIASAIGEDFHDTSSGAPTPLYRADADCKLDGVIDNLDLAIVTDAIGDTAPDLWTVPCSVGYAGGMREDVLDLWLFRNRWFDSENGKWLTRDPAGYVDGLNLYQYVSGNPLVYWDPFGLASTWCGQAVEWLHKEFESSIEEIGLNDTMVGDALVTASAYQAGWIDALGDVATDRIGDVLSGGYQIGEEVVVLSGNAAGLVDRETLMERSGVAKLAYAAEIEGPGKVAADIGQSIVDGSKDYAAAVASGDLEAIGDGFNAAGMLGLAGGAAAWTKGSLAVQRGLTTPNKFFSKLDADQARDSLSNKYGAARSTRDGADTYYNPQNNRSYNVHTDPDHGAPHVDIRTRGPIEDRKAPLKRTEDDDG